MRLSDKQIADLKNELADALVSSFPEKEILELIVRRVLKTEINKITQGEQLFETTVSRVVDRAESHGQIAKLVIGASLQNSGNIMLQQFVRKNLGSLLCLEFNAVLDESLLLSLSDALQAGSHTQTFEEAIVTACYRTLRDVDAGVPDLRQQLDSDVSSSVKLLILLDLFLRKWERSHNECLHIALFVHYLSFSVVGAAKSKLMAWLDSLPALLQLPSGIVSSGANFNRTSEDALKTLLARFIVLVEPLETSDAGHYVASGYITTRLGEEDNTPCFEKIMLLPTSVIVDDSAIEKKGYTIAEIEALFPDWLIQASEAIGIRSLDIQQNCGLELPPAQEIAVEFWLPFELLSDAVEMWKIYKQPLRRKRLGRLLSASKYKVLVRSYERLVEAQSFNALLNTWQKMAAENSQPSSSRTQASYCFDGWEVPPGWQAYTKSSAMGISTACAICNQQYENHREDLFAWMLDEGVPLAVWSRDVDLAEPDKRRLAQEMEAWVSAASPAQLAPLFENIYQARRRDSNNLLALWCDDPRRVVELKKFRKEGRLQA